MPADERGAGRSAMQMEVRKLTVGYGAAWVLDQVSLQIGAGEFVGIVGCTGCGKTTLLKEIIVSNIIEKARLLAEYADPDEAFDDYSFQHGNGPGNSYNQ